VGNYNDYESIKQLPYNIFTHLLNENEDIWKLLYYTTPDALSPLKPNLTKEQKTAMVWKGESDSANFRIFFQPFISNAFSSECAQLRIYPLTIHPTNSTNGLVDFAIEILTHGDINPLDNYSTRILTLLQEIIKTLNDAEISAVGNLFFNKMGSSYDMARLNLYNNISYIGYTLIMSVHV